MRQHWVGVLSSHEYKAVNVDLDFHSATHVSALLSQVSPPRGPSDVVLCPFLSRGFLLIFFFFYTCNEVRSIKHWIITLDSSSSLSTWACWQLSLPKHFWKVLFGRNPVLIKNTSSCPWPSPWQPPTSPSIPWSFGDLCESQPVPTAPPLGIRVNTVTEWGYHTWAVSLWADIGPLP